MEKMIRLGMVVLFIALLHSTCTIRTPERILKQQFNITLKEFDYKIETFEEEWCPNGDGELLIVAKFNNLTQENIDYIKSIDNIQSLPVSELKYQQMGVNKIPKQLLKADTGYYIYQVGRISSVEEIKGIKMALDFSIFIVDTKTNKAVLYFQSM